MSQKVLVVTGDGGESYESLYAVHRLREAGFEVVVAAPSKRRLHLVIHDFEPGWDTYIERQGYGLDSDLAIKEVRADDYLAVLVLGGRAPEYLRHDSTLVSLIQQFAKLDRWVFSICHGIQVLIAAGLVKGRTVTCYEHVRNEVEFAGGRYSTEEACRDGRIVTAQTWQSHPEFYRLVVSCLQDSAI